MSKKQEFIDKNIFLKQNELTTDEKNRYYQLMDKRINFLCADSQRKTEYINYLEYLLRENKISYYRPNML